MSNERYIPPLLTRLTDDEPESRIDKQDRMFSLAQIKEDILLNITQLFNSRSHRQYAELNNDVNLIHSVLGYGVSDFCGVSNSPKEKERLILEITDQIKFFEPRLKASSITVKSVDIAGEVNVLTFVVSAQYALYLADESFECMTKLDLESGVAKVEVRD